MKMHQRIEREKEGQSVDGPFQCEICGREFLQLQSVKIHLGKHRANGENNLQEYLEKRALRLAASKARSRQKSKVYKAKYKEMKVKKIQMLENLGIDPGNPLAKNIIFKDVVDGAVGTGADGVVVQEIQEMQQQHQEDDGTSNLSTEQDTTTTIDGAAIGVNNEIKVVGNSVVLGSPMDPTKTLEYVVSDSATVIVGGADGISELNVENMAPSFSLLSFIKQTATKP